ncbi:hypothetical protein LTSEINV_6358, partial [Salmonella enterica subsp. enterica serovar Inverness str. R8-3668]
ISLTTGDFPLSQRQKQACCDRSGHAAPGAPWPALFASRQTDAGL